MNRALLLIMVLCYLMPSLGWPEDNKGRNIMEEIQNKDILNDPVVMSVARALKIANTRALELGYQIEGLSISIIQEGKIWKIDYIPKVKIQRGGGLTILVNQEGKIVEIKHGQ